MNSINEAIWQHAGQTPDKLCVTDGKRELSYAAAVSAITSLAGYLREQGVERGGCVLLQNSQNAAFICTVLAVQLLGGVSIPVEKRVATERVREIVDQTGAVLCILARPAEDENIRTWKEIGSVMDAAAVGNAQPAVSEAEARELAAQAAPEDLAEILFTTGTTGKSKGIEITHGNITAVVENVIDGVEMTSDTVEIIPVPLSHSHGLRRLYSHLYNGSSAVLTDGVIFVNRVFDLMERCQVTAMDLVPAALASLFQLSGERIGEWKDRLEYIQLGSAPLPEGDKDHLCALLPHTRLYNFYGTTESGCSCILNFNDGVERRSCIGRPTVNAHFAFFNDEGQIIEATPEHPGLLGCSGPMNMRGYYKSPELNRETFKQGYIVTQDLSYPGEDGMIYLLGRQGDVITCGGNKIAPDEIEEAAGGLEGIADCACIATPDPILGEAPVLYYTLAPHAGITWQQIADHLKGILEAYKVPKEYQLIDEIPRSYNGKIQRAKLRKMREESMHS